MYSIDVKKRFLTFFYFGHVFTFLNVFFNFPDVLYFLKKRWQSSERQADNKKHFQNNSNEIVSNN